MTDEDQKSLDDYVREYTSLLVERDHIPWIESMRQYFGDAWADSQIWTARMWARL